jgi:hypothetical protein
MARGGSGHWLAGLALAADLTAAVDVLARVECLSDVAAVLELAVRLMAAAAVAAVVVMACPRLELVARLLEVGFWQDKKSLHAKDYQGSSSPP